MKDLAEDPNRHIILVTATPHNGMEDSFRSLLGLINPEFDSGSANTKLDRKKLLPHMVQRRRAAEFWRRAEQHRKSPWRLVGTFGPLTLLLFLARRLDLDAAFRRVSKVIGIEARAIQMPTAEAAVDVDKISDLELVNRIFAEREK